MTLIDGLSLATKAGNAKAVSSVILGHLSLHLDISKDTWFSIIEDKLPKKVVDVNFRAFDSGREIDKIP